MRSTSNRAYRLAFLALAVALLALLAYILGIQFLTQTGPFAQGASGEWASVLSGVLFIGLVTAYLWTWWLRRQAIARAHQLQSERDFVQALFHTMGDGLVMLDASDRFEMGNQAFYELIGYTREELQGRVPFWMQLVPSAPVPSKPVTESNVQRYECRLIHKTGHVIDVLVSETAQRAPDGTPQGRIAVYTDITARKRLYAREQRRVAESLTLLDIAQAVSSTLDLTKVLKVVAQRAAQVCEVHRCTILLLGEGGRIEPFMSQLASGERDLAMWRRFKHETYLEADTQVPAVAELIRQRQPRVFLGDDLAALPRNWIEPYGIKGMLALPLVSRDRVIGIMALDYVDATQTFSEEQVRLVQAIAGQAAVAILNARLYAQVQYRAAQLQTAAEVSRGASSILDPDELIQQTVDLVRNRFDLYYVGIFLVDQDGTWTGEPGKWAVLRAGTGEAGRNMLEQGHRLEVGGGSMIGLCIASQRAHIALDVGAEPVRFDNPLLPDTRSELALPLISRGQVIGAMTVQSAQEAAFTDVDIVTLQTMADQVANAIENARLYAQVQQDIEKLRKLDELKSDFVAVVSHELRTPLTSVIAYSETLLQGRVGLLTPQQQHFAEVIRQSAYEQLRIVDDLLDLSRLETGRMTLHVEEISLASVVVEVLRTVTPMAGSKNQHLVNRVSPDIPPIRADPDRVRQILLNLVSNGVKFTPPGGRITITAEAVAPDEVQVAVHDTGVGIAPEHQHLIFEKFTQVEKPLTRQHPGIGLGLPIARVLVELHGGRIWVESVPGQGSTFYLTLPLANSR